MRKLFLSFSVIAAFVAYSLHQQSEESDVHVVAPKKATNTPQPTNVSSSSTDTPPPTQTPTQATGVYKNGSYIGNVTDAFYGNIQVKAIIQNGKITDVQFLQYPNDRRESMMINMQAMPYLKQEAIQAQNAQVDIVSGATQTSEAFMQSLNSALKKAKG